MICVVSGDMMGEVWRELEVVTDEVLMAEAGTDVAEELIED
tara:strand:- start:372 stop:494 length:123 start_codon:yes stop_codon:yes gene_type:complete